MNRLRPLLLSAALGLALAAPAASETYRASTWLPDGETTTHTLYWFADALKAATGGAITMEVFSGGTLMPAKSHLQGIGDGVVQLGFHTSAYTPSELPIANALSGYGFLMSDPVTIGLAWADFMMHDAEQNAEFRAHGVVPVGAFSTPTYPIICNTAQPVTELEQMKGLKIRSIGLIGKLVTDLGGVAVNIPAPEIYQALQNGQIDCASILAAYLNIDNRLDEVSKSTTMMEWTGSYNSPLQLYNEGFWQDLTDDQRRAIFELAARGQAKVQVRFQTLQQKSLDDAAAKGHVVTAPGESIRNAVDAWIANGVGDMAGVARDTYGVKDPEALFARFAPYVAKWQGLVGAMTDKFDEEELTQLILANLYADIDPATYGMN